MLSDQQFTAVEIMAENRTLWPHASTVVHSLIEAGATPTEQDVALIRELMAGRRCENEDTRLIWHIIEYNSPVKLADIRSQLEADGVEMSQPRLSRCLERLCRQGHARRIRLGVYGVA